MTEITKARADQIDTLRTFAVAGVVFSHTIDERYVIGQYQFFEFGAYGVFLFFVISAFLITSQLLATKEVWRRRGDGLHVPLKSFYIKRALRLMPAYYAVLLLLVVLDLGTIRAEAPWHAVMLTNVLFGLVPRYEEISPVGHFWSLSVEWQFYIVWPFVVLLLSERKLLWVTISVLIVAAAKESSLLPIPDALDRMSIIDSLDSLAFGALLAIAIHRGWRPERWLWVAWPAAAVMLIAPVLYMFRRADIAGWFDAISGEAMNLFFAALVLAASRGFGGLIGRVLDNRLLRYLGVISYGIYLYHQILIEVYWRGFDRLGRAYPLGFGAKLSLLIFIGASIVAALSWHFFEAPINRFRHRFDYRDRAEPPAMTDAALYEAPPLGSAEPDPSAARGA